MLVVEVSIQVKPEFVEAFKAAVLANAGASLKEPGVARFDVLQQQDDRTRFVLSEAYRTPEDQAKHKQTTHYAAWAAAVAPMMAEPRIGTKYVSVFPDDAEW